MFLFLFFFKYNWHTMLLVLGVQHFDSTIILDVKILGDKKSKINLFILVALRQIHMHILDLHICVISTDVWEVQDYRLLIHKLKKFWSNFVEIKQMEKKPLKDVECLLETCYQKHLRSQIAQPYVIAFIL